MPGEYLDLASEDGAAPATPEPSRRYVGIHFACCGVYARVYLNAGGTCYEGHCPRCTKRVELKVAPGGTDARFFTAY